MKASDYNAPDLALFRHQRVGKSQIDMLRKTGYVASGNSS